MLFWLNCDGIFVMHTFPFILFYLFVYNHLVAVVLNCEEDFWQMHSLKCVEDLLQKLCIKLCGEFVTDAMYLTVWKTCDGCHILNCVERLVTDAMYELCEGLVTNAVYLTMWKTCHRCYYEIVWRVCDRCHILNHVKELSHVMSSRWCTVLLFVSPRKHIFSLPFSTCTLVYLHTITTPLVFWTL